MEKFYECGEIMKKLVNVNDTNIHFGFYAKYLKRILDVIVSFIIIVFFSPLLFIIAVLVKLKLGSPILFIQTRAGKDEIPFHMIKFRTMSNQRNAFGELLPDEQRFTKLGNFLRDTSLDELPELFNVLKGDMSLIGPRPLYSFYIPYYTEEESIRHAVRGGITGLAQINGRALCPMDQRLQYDIEYVKNITFCNDIRILWKTISKVLNRSDIGIPSIEDEKCLNETREIQRPNHIIKEYL